MPKFLLTSIEYLPDDSVEDREIHKDMKTTSLITIAIAALGLFAAAPSADARHRYSNHVFISGYRTCGTPIYKERYFIGYDRCGYPIWRYRVVAAPARYCPPPPRYYRPPVACPPRYPYYGGYPRNGVVISGSFRL